MGTVSEVQHRKKITIWVDDKNKFDYYLAEESFLNCFTDIEVDYKCINADRYNNYNRSNNNIYIIPIKRKQDINNELKNIDWNKLIFLLNHNIKIIVACGHLTLDNFKLETNISSTFLKVLCNDTDIKDDRFISINSYPVKLWNFYGSKYIEHRKFNVLKEPKYLKITDDREWWDTEKMEEASITKINKKEHIWKALMIGQPFIFKNDSNLNEMGFKEYPWINEKVDKMFVRKNSYFINKHNKENFNKIVKENDNYAIFAKKVFTF